MESQVGMEIPQCSHTAFLRAPLLMLFTVSTLTVDNGAALGADVLQPGTDVLYHPPEWSSRQPLGYFTAPVEARVPSLESSQSHSQSHPQNNNSLPSGPLRLSASDSAQRPLSGLPGQATNTPSASGSQQRASSLPFKSALHPQSALWPLHALNSYTSTSLRRNCLAAPDTTGLPRGQISQTLVPPAITPTDTTDLVQSFQQPSDRRHLSSTPFASFKPTGLKDFLKVASPKQAVERAEADTATSGSLDPADSSVRVDPAQGLALLMEGIAGWLSI